MRWFRQERMPKPWKDKQAGSIERNELLKTVKCLGRTLWKKWEGYHYRSLVETKMHCIKLLGDKLSARNFQSQVNEIQACIAILNKFTELGRPYTKLSLKFEAPKRTLPLNPLCNKAAMMCHFLFESVYWNDTDFWILQVSYKDYCLIPPLYFRMR